jgi:hypothetical protein
MPIIDNRTANLNLPLPHSSNSLEDDVPRLRDALTAIDAAQTFAALLSKPTTIGGYAITDAFTKTEINALFTALKNGAPANLDTLGEIAASLQATDAAHAALVQTFNSHAGSTSGHPLATTLAPGFMSAADKVKSDAFNGALYMPAGNIAVASPVDLANVSLAAGTSDSALAMVEGYGIYKYFSTSTELADGETIVTPSSGGGKWHLIAPSWDFVWANMTGVVDHLRKLIEAVPIYTPGNQPTVIRQDVDIYCPFMNNNDSIDETVTVLGASPGDFVAVTPAANFYTELNDDMVFHLVSIVAEDSVRVVYWNWGGDSGPATITFSFVIIKA